MKQNSFFRDLGDAFVRPFAPANWLRTLLGLLFCYLPFTYFIALGDAYSMAAGTREGWGSRAKLGFKILIAELLLAAPVLLVYGVCFLLGAAFDSIPLAVSVALVILTAILAVRCLLLAPIAACCLALGAPLRVAVSGRELKSVLSGCFWGYLLACLLNLLLLFAFGILTDGASLLVVVLTGGAITALTQYLAAGFFMSCCRASLGLPRPARPTGAPRGRAAVALLLTAALLLSALPTPVYAAQPHRISNVVTPPGSGGEKSEYTKALEELAKQDLHGGSPIDLYDQQRTAKNWSKAGWLTLHVVDVGLDFVPAVANLKNGCQAVYYGVKGYVSDNPEVKQQAYVDMTWKISGIVLGGIARGAKAAKAAGGLVIYKISVSAAQAEKAHKMISAVENGVKVYDGVNNLLKGSDIVTGREDGEVISPNGILTVGKYFVDKAFQDEFTPATKLPKGSGPSGAYTIVVPSDGSLPTLPALPGDLDQTEPLEESRPVRSDMVGAYWGYAAVPTVAVPGVSYNLSQNDVYVAVNNDGTANFDYTMELSIAVSYYGTGNRTKTTVRISEQGLTPETADDGRIAKYHFSKRIDTEAGVTYFGEGYESSGNVTVPYSATYTVDFTVSRNPAWPRVSGEPEFYATGTISIIPLAEENASITVLSFTCK